MEKKYKYRYRNRKRGEKQINVAWWKAKRRKRSTPKKSCNVSVGCMYGLVVWQSHFEIYVAFTSIGRVVVEL